MVKYSQTKQQNCGTAFQIVSRAHWKIKG